MSQAVESQVKTEDSQQVEHRRTFMRKAMAILAGAVAVLIPGGAGLAVLLDPLRKKSRNTSFIRITTLDSIPDGAAKTFSVEAEKQDAWNKYIDKIGAVHLRRQGDSVVAFNAKCPHAGCFVDVAPNGEFHCPCHNSRFGPDGSLLPGSVSPRGLDELEVDPISLKDGIVQVRFQNFSAGTHQRIPQP